MKNLHGESIFTYVAYAFQSLTKADIEAGREIFGILSSYLLNALTLSIPLTSSITTTHYIALGVKTDFKLVDGEQ